MSGRNSGNSKFRDNSGKGSNKESSQKTSGNIRSSAGNVTRNSENSGFQGNNNAGNGGSGTVDIAVDFGGNRLVTATELAHQMPSK